MDTKLKKTHRFTTIIITLCILIPAFLLVSLYPRTRSVMQQEKDRIEKINQEMGEKYDNDSSRWRLEQHFINYAMESCYFLYSTIVSNERSETGENEPLNLNIFEEYGWISDYHTFRDNVNYRAVYTGINGDKTESDTEDLEGISAFGYLNMVFDSNGYLDEIYLDGDIVVDLGGSSDNNLYDVAMRTVKQLQNNVLAYNQTHDEQLDASDYMPKNFLIKISLLPSCQFVYDEYEFIGHGYINYENLLFETGVILVIIAVAVLVAIMALIHPFFKKLETGWEKIFRAPFEVVLLLLGCGIAGAVGMFYAMAYTCGMEYYPSLQLVGFPISERTQYVFLLVMNFFGWAVVFFMEYIVVASLRQFLCSPKIYIRNRMLCVRAIRWLKKQCYRLQVYLKKIDIHENFNKSVLKLVLANFVVLLFIFCIVYFILGQAYGCFYNDDWFLIWLLGILMLTAYSWLLYILALECGKKLKKHYYSVLHATEQMAEGNLKISLEEDLGVFQSIGDSLNEVQKGFEKAVVEEAKSQNMKTELITNVSHDLKTPLTAIITYVDLLKKENITEEERKSYVQTLDQKSQRLRVLIEDLFEVSKAQSGNVTMNFMDVDIVNLMKQVRMEMEDQIEASNLAFRFNLPEEKIILSLDGQRTYRIFENLLNNALKYAMPHSRVYVDILQNTEEVKVVFRNISAQELDYEPDRLTERFVRGDASRNSEGSGLGLAIAKSFTELQGGKFKIEVDGDLFKVLLAWSR